LTYAYLDTTILLFDKQTEEGTMNSKVEIDFTSTAIAAQVKHDLIDAMRATGSGVGREFLAGMIGEVSMWIYYHSDGPTVPGLA
jgi:hypothetical protein